MATVKGSAGVIQNLILQALLNILAALGGGSTGVIIARFLGANTVASAQVTAGAVAGTLAAARATRRQVTFKNTDSSNTVWIGPATVTALNGMQLLAGQSITVSGTILWQVIAPAGSPVVCVTDEYYS